MPYPTPPYPIPGPDERYWRRQCGTANSEFAESVPANRVPSAASARERGCSLIRGSVGALSSWFNVIKLNSVSVFPGSAHMKGPPPHVCGAFPARRFPRAWTPDQQQHRLAATLGPPLANQPCASRVAGLGVGFLGGGIGFGGFRLWGFNMAVWELVRSKRGGRCRPCRIR